MKNSIDNLIANMGLTEEVISHCDKDTIQLELKGRKAILCVWKISDNNFYRATFFNFNKKIEQDIVIQVGTDGIAGVITSAINAMIADYKAEEKSKSSPDQN